MISVSARNRRAGIAPEDRKWAVRCAVMARSYPVGAREDRDFTAVSVVEKEVHRT